MNKKEIFFRISLGQWSLHRTYFGETSKLGKADFLKQLQNNPGRLLQGEINPLYFARHARKMFGIDAIEYVNTFYFDKAENPGYLHELKKIADNEGVKSVLIMCDAEGALDDPDSVVREQAVKNHYKWVDMAKYLGCHAIRVNTNSKGSFEEQMKYAADGLRKLTEFAAKVNINVVVENHGGLSSHGRWLAETIRMVDHPNCGTLPDFGNFSISETEQYDIYKGTEELMPLAKGVSAKTFNFDENGNEAKMDYYRLMKIVKDAGYTGYVGIEYEGDELTEEEGVRKTRDLLIKTGKELS